MVHIFIDLSFSVWGRLKAALFCFVAFFCLDSYGQLTFGNPSFEGPPAADVTPAPWNICGGTPDTQPGYYGVTYPPFHGNTYVGFQCLAQTGEGCSQLLSSPMLAGQNYTITMRLRGGGYIATPSPGALCIYGGNNYCAFGELLWQSAPASISATAWTLFSISFTPTSNYSHITFVSCTPGSVHLDSLSWVVAVGAPKPQAKFVVTTVCKGQATAFTDSSKVASGTITGWKWNFGDASGTSTAANPTYTYGAAGTYTVKLVVTTDAGEKDSITKTVIVHPTPSDLNLSATMASCGQSNATVSVMGVTGGTSPYTYSYNSGPYTSSTSEDSLAAGNHKVKVKDQNGCMYEENIAVTADPGITAISYTEQRPACAQSIGSITITSVTGGNPPYSYAINGGTYSASNTFTGLAPGSHTLKIKDSGTCTYQKNVNLLDIPGPSDFKLELVNSSCGGQNGAIKVISVTGGTAPYSYAINSGSFYPSGQFVYLLAGSHTVRVKDANGCLYSRVVNIVDQPGPGAINATTAAASCGQSDGSITITGVMGGTAPYTYSINGGPFSSQAIYTGLPSGSYDIQAKDANGCTFLRAVIISNTGGPSGAVIDSTLCLCGQATGSIKISGVTGGQPPYTYALNTDPFQSSGLFTALSAGNYLVTIKDKKGCLYTRNIQVPQAEGPSSSAFTVTDETCTGSNGAVGLVNVSGGQAPYTYSLNGGPFGAGALFNNLAAGTYSITVKDANNCLLTRDTTVADHPAPTDFTANSTTDICNTRNGTLTILSVIGGEAPYRFSANDTNYQTTATFTDLPGGKFTVFIKDANNCSFSRIENIPSIDGPNGMDVSLAPTSCGQSLGTITINTVAGGTAPYLFALNTGGYQASNFFGNLFAGSYTIHVKDDNGCIYQEVHSIIDQGSPTGIQFSFAKTTCGLSNGSITVTGTSGGKAPYLYALNGSPFSAQTSFTNLAAGSHNLAVQDANGCQYSTVIPLADQPGPTAANLSPVAATCGQSNGEVRIAAVTGGTSPYEYSLDNTSFQPGNTFSGLAAGPYTVYIRDYNQCQFSTSTLVVALNGPTDVSAALSSPTCGAANGSVAVTNVTGGFPPYTYALNGGNFQAGSLFSALQPGTHNLTVKDANGCTFTRAFTLTEKGGPADMDFLAESSACGAANGKITITAATGGTMPYMYALDGGSFQSSPIFAGIIAKAYQVAVRDANNCVYTEAVTVGDIPGPTALLASVISTTCGKSNGELNVTSVTGGTPPYAYAVDGGNYDRVDRFTSLSAGTHSISVRDNNNCIYTDQFLIAGIPGPTDIQALIAPENCDRSDGKITVTGITGGTAPYRISLDEAGAGQSNAFSSLPAGTYTIQVEDASNCIYTQAVTVPYAGFPVAEIGASATVGEVPFTVFMLNRSRQYDAAYWDFGNGDESTNTNAIATYADSGQYRIMLVAINSAGCADTAYEDIHVFLPVQIFIPNAFTPEGDGFNDYFNVSTYAISSFTMKIYNRWGELLAEWHEVDPGWNGLYQNGPLKNDVYLYRFEGHDIYGTRHYREGVVLLSR